MAKQRRRKFGGVRKLGSGRWQATYIDPVTAARRPAPYTFETETQANDWLIGAEADMIRGRWVDPDIGREPFGPYADKWIDERPNLRVRTKALYLWLNKRYLQPEFAKVDLVDITPPMVRSWRADLMADKHLSSCKAKCADKAHKGVSATMAAKAYRLLRAILMTATDDELIKRNPCRIVGAGTERPRERPILNIAQVFKLAEQMPRHLRVFVLIATFASLRWGEVTAIQRKDIDLTKRTIRIRQQWIEVVGSGMELHPPKSGAGVRTVSIPELLVPLVQEHLDEFVAPGRDAFVFLGERGAVLRRSNFNKLGWSKAAEAVGAKGLHFHDLRHTGNTFAAQSGASTKDLMARMGQDSMNAAIIYQHATRQADGAIAAAMNDAIEEYRRAHGDEGGEASQAG
ncbi:site-specific integrase [Kribbella sp. NBC_01245]|uniref:tyrosine-type recombinase/integrase n=1 Tax=Kribbella sp. NBC_01245 TaxID=2903578 RepID=UPI002E2852C5|nr:tyrosine-type recombinase/integrase [Kribbella sp. NBC_01245]